MLNWQDIDSNDGIFTDRAEVKGGCLARCTTTGHLESAITLTLVPDENRQWETLDFI